MAKTKIPNIDKLTIASYRYLNNVLALLTTFWLMRLFDVFVLSHAFSFPSGLMGDHLFGLVFDTYFIFKVAGILLLPYLLITLLRMHMAQHFFIISGIIIVTVNLLLLVYFATTKVMLGSDVFSYSANDIRETLQSTSAVTVVNLIPFVVFPLVYVVLQHYLARIKMPNVAYYIFYPLVAIVFLTSGYSIANASSFKSSIGSNLATNKFGYFTHKAFEYIAEIEQIENAKKGNFDGVQSVMFASTDYVSKEYPLLHIDKTPDVLSPFFDTTSTHPNIVFIFVESLGRAYSGEGAELGSYTPFLDSLSRKGLYFENFLSTAGRTFGVFPSVLGSLPLVNRGFMELRSAMPEHNSIITLLHGHGYKSNFVYGGEAKFDNMQQFFERQHVGRVIDVSNFGLGYEKMPPNNQGFSWGYGDRDILAKVADLKGNNIETPSVSVALTLSMHDPFRVKNQPSYVRLFEQILKNSPIPKKRKEFVAKYSQQISTVLYFDESLRQFFKKYQQLPSFKNTIFIITGDHRMPEIPIGTQIDRFRVPFVIYSPMLTRTARFKSVSTQFDVVPSLIALLRNKAKMQFPNLVHWVGDGLDTARNFRNIHKVSFMENKNEQTCYLDGLNFIAMKKLYTITPNLGLVEVSNPTLLGEMTKKLNSIKNISAFVCSNNKLMPDSLRVNPVVVKGSLTKK
jgi:phosphoglycerol transferase MdoB-like AlkP superfamily enzyme